MISVGERLNNFNILIGNEFVMGVTGAADIGAWSECAHVSGRQLFVSYIFIFKRINQFSEKCL